MSDELRAVLPVIALVELYKVRHGAYPESLADIDFAGDWDQMPINAVEYKKLPEGYELNIVNGWVSKPTLKYPASFWHGLGIKQSNVKMQK